MMISDDFLECCKYSIISNLFVLRVILLAKPCSIYDNVTVKLSISLNVQRLRFDSDDFHIDTSHTTYYTSYLWYFPTFLITLLYNIQ